MMNMRNKGICLYASMLLFLLQAVHASSIQNVSGISYNGTFNVSEQSSHTINMTTLSISATASSSSQSSSAVHASIGPYVGITTVQGYDTLGAFSISVRPHSGISVMLTEAYECGISSASLQPFALDNGTWIRISQFSTDQSACTITYAVPDYPVVGLFEAKPQAQAAASANAPAPEPSPSPVGVAAPAIAVIAIAIAIAVAYSYSLRPKKHR